jgi:phospholipase/lecithinase/hemolysin
MKHFRSWAVSALAGALLLACGGGDPYVAGSEPTSGAPTTRGTFTAVVSFGDSLSDLGTYTPATSIAGNGSAPYLGGKWTTNTTPQTATLWVENIATGLGLLITPNEVGFAGQSVRCPAGANPALATTCTGYGQAGARVTDPVGTGNASGALTVPLKTQIERHLATFTRFGSGDLIFVWGGNNDALEQLSVFGAAATQILTRQAQGQIGADEASNLLLEAQLAGLGEMKKAALELSAYVKGSILANGGRYVAVVNLPDPASTPFGVGFAANPQTRALAPVFSALAENFNLWLREGLKGQPVQILDAWGLFKQIRANPGNYGLLNVSDPTCNFAIQDAVLGRVLTSGRAMFCNVTTGAPFDMKGPGADPDTWLFADDFHPSTGGHRVIAQEFTKQLRAFGWIN